MKLSRPFIIIIIVLFAFMLFVDAFMPHRFDWDADFSGKSEEPLNCALFDKVMMQSMPGRYSVSGKTLAEWDRADSSCRSILVVDENIYIDSTSYVHIDNLLKKGNNVIIATGGSVDDTLKCYIAQDRYSSYSIKKNEDSVQMVWVGPGFKKEKFDIRCCMAGANVDSYDKEWQFLLCVMDTTRKYDLSSYDDSIEEDSVIEEYGYNYYSPSGFGGPRVKAPLGKGIALMRNQGKGKFIICGDPYLFSNYAMRHSNLTTLAMRILSQVSDKPIVRIDESLRNVDNAAVNPQVERSMFRVFLSNPPLRWALYLAFFTVILSLFFTARRRQRVIPVIKRPVNYTMAMIKHIGTLYYQRRDHKDLVEKKYLYFADELRRHAMVDVDDVDHLDSEIDALSTRTGISTAQLKNDILDIQEKVFYVDTIDVHTMQATVDKMNNIISKL